MESSTQGPFLHPTHTQIQTDNKLKSDSSPRLVENENEDDDEMTQNEGRNSSPQLSSLEMTLGKRLEMVASHSDIKEALNALVSWTDLKLQNIDGQGNVHLLVYSYI